MVAILVALMFVGLVLFDAVLQKIEARRTLAIAPRPASMKLAPAIVLNPAVQGVPKPQVGSFPWAVPQGVYLSEGHAWFKPDPSGEVQVGADALVAHALGSLEKVVFPMNGDVVRKGQPLFHLVHEGNVLAVSSSVTARVVAVNTALRDRPELLARDPYGAGWVCQIASACLDDGSGRMRCADKAAFWLECEFDRFREFISAHVAPDLALGLTSLDGGLPEIGSLTQLDDVAWNAFEAEFLRTT
jgi:glycine cleavage system H protein